MPDWLPQSCWQSVLALKEISEYHALPEDLVSSSKRWKEWLELERPEDEPLPGLSAAACYFLLLCLGCASKFLPMYLLGCEGRSMARVDP